MGSHVGHDGTAEDPIVVMAYPGETPILDGSLFVRTAYATAIEMEWTNFWKIKGLTVRNFWQRGLEVECYGFGIYGGSNITLENCTAHNISGEAFSAYLSGGYGSWGSGIAFDTTKFINCDAYNCIDTTSTMGEGYAGNYADAWKVNSSASLDKYGYVSFEGCRAWNCSDDALDIGGIGLIVVKNCWLFDLGKLEGDGCGFKTGGTNSTTTPAAQFPDSITKVVRIITRNLIAWCNGTGIAVVEYPYYYRLNARIYNNTSYNNAYGYNFSINALRPTVLAQYKNNLSYQDGITFSSAYQIYTESHNSWDRIEGWPNYEATDAFTVTNTDFLTIDSAAGYNQLTAGRKADGSLPDITFLRLTAGSDLVNQGTTDVIAAANLTYTGDSPDVGYDEWVDAPDSTATNIITFTLSAQKNQSTISTSMHTVAITVVNGTDVTALEPTITMDYGATINPTSGTARNFTNPIDYTVTSLGTDSTQVWHVTVTIADPDAPTVSTSTVTTYNAGSATLVGTIVSDGATTITASGFVWSTSESPTLANGNIVPNTTRTETTFSNSISPLQKGTTYHVRAYSTNSAGTSYGANVSFTTPALGMIQNGGSQLIWEGKLIIY